MKNFEELENFISTHKDNWQILLKKAPYNLKTIRAFETNPNWFILVYNLFESDFTNPICKQCRGTVVEINEDGIAHVICGPYTKFFNWNDPNSDISKIDWNTARCYSKIDGQLISMFKYNGRDYWKTNGGTGLNTPIDYETEDIKNYKQLMAKALLASDSDCNISENDFSCKMNWIKKVPDGWTLMFELTSPQNKIIVKYNETKLWFHGARDSEGNEHFPEEVKEMFSIPYDIPKIYEGVHNIDEAFSDYLNTMNGSEEEGLVICDANFNRIKVKCESYLKMKFVRDTADSSEALWKIVVTEQYDDLLSQAPELKETIDNILKDYKKFLSNLKSTIAYAIEVYELDKNRNRKEFALWVNEQIKNSVWKNIFFIAIDKGAVDTYTKVLKDLIESKDGFEKYQRLLKPLS